MANSQPAARPTVPGDCEPDVVVHVDCVIVGAGWTGLSVAAALRAYGVERFVMLEAGSGPGAFWEGNYERIRLHTPWHGLPCDGGMSLYKYPMFKPKKEVVNYLHDYYQLHRLEPHARFGERVKRVSNLGHSSWEVESLTDTGGRRRYLCKFVAVCTSKLRVPMIPKVKDQEFFSGRVLHSREYRSGKAFKAQDVLVVGSGNSAAEICADLVESGAGSVTMLVHGPRLFVPLPRLGFVARLGRLMGALTEEHAFADWRLEFGTDEFWASVKKKDDTMKSMSVDLSKHGIAPPELGFAEANIKSGRIGVFDQGAIKMIESGRIGVRKARLTKLTETTAELDDSGSPLAVHSIVMATGFQPKLEDFVEDAERFLERGQEGKGCGLSYWTPRTDLRCRSSVDNSLFFVAFDQAVNGGLSMGFWGWSCGFSIAQDLGLIAPGAQFSLEKLPEQQRHVRARRRAKRAATVLLLCGAGLAILATKPSWLGLFRSRVKAI